MEGFSCVPHRAFAALIVEETHKEKQEDVINLLPLYRISLSGLLTGILFLGVVS